MMSSDHRWPSSTTSSEEQQQQQQQQQQQRDFGNNNNSNSSTIGGGGGGGNNTGSDSPDYARSPPGAAAGAAPGPSPAAAAAAATAAAVAASLGLSCGGAAAKRESRWGELPGGSGPSFGSASGTAGASSSTGGFGKGLGIKRPSEGFGGLGGPDAKKMAAPTVAPGLISSQNSITEEWSVPDKMVGLIIGRDGKQIMKLQQESLCKVQLSSESNGTSERPCTLTGSKQAVERAKELISALISRGQEAAHKGTMNGGPGVSQNEITVDIPCPGHKAGLVIGRGGETIRSLQERAGVKMVVVQDATIPSHLDKPIRITGDPSKVEYAKQLVMDLISGAAPANGGAGGPMGGPGGMMGGGPDGGLIHEQLRVPRQAVGVVIGKQGETIKRIQQDSGARVQFQTPTDENQPERICVVSGQSQQVMMACGHISELIQSVLRRDDENNAAANSGGMGPLGGGIGRGRGGLVRGGGPAGALGRGATAFRGGRGGMVGLAGRGGAHMGGAPGGMSGMGGPEQQECQMPVPANRCGLVIGKGGETIRHIMQQSGAYIELSRTTNPTPTEKFFTIRGTPASIETAQQLIAEKVNSIGVGGPPGAGPPAGMGMGMGMGVGMGMGGGPGGANGAPGGYQQPPGGYGGPGGQGGYGQGPPAQYGPGPVGGPPGPMGPGGPPQNAWGQPAPYQTPAANGTAQWGQPPTSATPNGDMSGKPQDPSAAWAAYYQQYYHQPQAQQQQQQPPQSQPPPQQPQRPPAAAPGAPPAAGVGATPAPAPAPGGPPQPSAAAGAAGGGQPDYSQAWIDYYRQLGMYQEAEMIERQTRGGAAGATAAASAAGQPNPAAVPQPQQQQPQHQPQQAGAPGGPGGVAQNGAPWGAAPYGAPGGAYGGAPAAPQPYGAYGYPSA